MDKQQVLESMDRLEDIAEQIRYEMGVLGANGRHASVKRLESAAYSIMDVVELTRNNDAVRA